MPRRETSAPFKNIELSKARRPKFGLAKAFFDEITVTGRCARSASASLGLYQIENKLHDSYVTDELIESRKQRNKVLALVHASRKKNSPDVPDVFPNLKRFKPGQNWHGDRNTFAARRTEVSVAGKLNRIRGTLYTEWSGETLPNYEFGLCRLSSCKKIVIAHPGRPALFHGKCYSAWH